MHLYYFPIKIWHIVCSQTSMICTNSPANLGYVIPCLDAGVTQSRISFFAENSITQALTSQQLVTKRGYKFKLFSSFLFLRKICQIRQSRRKRSCAAPWKGLVNFTAVIGRFFTARARRTHRGDFPVPFRFKWHSKLKGLHRRHRQIHLVKIHART